MHIRLALIIAMLLLSGCQHSGIQTAEEISENGQSQVTNASEAQLREIAEQFFKTYSQRDNFDSFLNHYSDAIVLEDLVYGERVEGKEAVRGFYRWDSPEVELIDQKALTVLEQIISGSHVVTRGVFLPFYYHGQKMGPWRFVIWQEFDDQGLIIKQFDWINYTPKETFIGGENLNNTRR